MEKNYSLESDVNNIATLFFDLINPYKGGQFVLIGLFDPAHSAERPTPPMFSPSPPQSRGSVSPPPLRGLFLSPQSASPPTSPRVKSQGPVISPPTSPRAKALGPSVAAQTSEERKTLKVVKTNVTDLSERSSKTLLSITSPRGSTQIAKSTSRVVSLPPSRERSREPSVIIDEIKLPKLSDEVQEPQGVEKTFNPVKPSIVKRGVFNVAKMLDKSKAEKSKKKGSLASSSAVTPVGTPLMSLNSSPVLARLSVPQKDFSYWNEIIPGSGLYLGVQPTKSNHPFILDNPEFEMGLSNIPYILNPAIFTANTEKADSVRGCIFTFQETYEMNGGLIDDETVLDHHVFHQLGIMTKWLPISDHTGNVNVQLALFRLFDMMDFYLRGLPIYLNCKSGKGRSAIFKIILLAFCFLLDKRVAIDKDCLLYYIDIDDPTVDQNKYNQIWMEKRMRLCKVVERINSADGGKSLSTSITPDEKPTKELLESLLTVCESVVRKDRKIKPSAEQRHAALIILSSIADCLYAPENTAHPKAKSPNAAYVDELTQAVVLKDIHVHMDGVTKNEDIPCKSFQEFLIRFVYNKKGWYEELVYATEGQNPNEGECGYFIRTANAADRAKRINFLSVFRKEIETLCEKYPRSDYAKDFLANKIKTQIDSPAQSPGPSVPSKSPRSLSFNSKQLSPRERSFTYSKSHEKPGELPSETTLRERSRTFGRSTLPAFIQPGMLSPRSLASSQPSSPRKPSDENLENSGSSYSTSESSESDQVSVKTL